MSPRGVDCTSGAVAIRDCSPYICTFALNLRVIHGRDLGLRILPCHNDPFRMPGARVSKLEACLDIALAVLPDHLTSYHVGIFGLWRKHERPWPAMVRRDGGGGSGCVMPKCHEIRSQCMWIFFSAVRFVCLVCLFCFAGCLFVLFVCV